MNSPGWSDSCERARRKRVRALTEPTFKITTRSASPVDLCVSARTPHTPRGRVNTPHGGMGMPPAVCFRPPGNRAPNHQILPASRRRLPVPSIDSRNQAERPRGDGGSGHEDGASITRVIDALQLTVPGGASINRFIDAVQFRVPWGASCNQLQDAQFCCNPQ
jgi:hypothetical protein